jgi:hypothetical protein
MLVIPLIVPTQVPPFGKLEPLTAEHEPQLLMPSANR